MINTIPTKGALWGRGWGTGQDGRDRTGWDRMRWDPMELKAVFQTRATATSDLKYFSTYVYAFRLNSAELC